VSELSNESDWTIITLVKQINNPSDPRQLKCQPQCSRQLMLSLCLIISVPQQLAARRYESLSICVVIPHFHLLIIFVLNP